MQLERSDVVAEGVRVLELAERSGVPLRLLGGAAIALRTPALPAQLARGYGDLDFVAAPGATASLSRLFVEAGYTPDQAFNTLHGKRRMIFLDPERGGKADVFVGAFEMCHRIQVAERLELEPLTLPLAELLLTKLQIVELNDKDVRDALALLAGHGVAEEDGDTINAARVAQLCASDWGLWRTITANLAAVRAYGPAYDIDVDAAVDALLARIETEPKSRAWRLRARVGERMRWFELPEDV